MKRVVVTDHNFPDLSIEREVLASVDVELIDVGGEDPANLINAVRDADALLNQYLPVPNEVIEEVDSLRAIGRYGIGVDTIDIETATENGVSVINVPTYCIEEVATHAFSLLLACARKVSLFDRSVKTGTWDWSIGEPIHRLSGGTLGIVAFGNIGQRLAEMAGGFGLEVIAYDPYQTQSELAEHDVRKVSFDELLAESDFVSIHAPLTTETEGMFDADTFRVMKESAILINTSRGSLVDTDALAEALTSGEIAAAGLDVLPTEPPETNELTSLDSTVVTPHVAWYSEESIHELRHTLASEVGRFLTGETVENIVNPPSEQ